MEDYKTALVTGGAGFIGSHIVEALIDRGVHVYVVDDLSSGSLQNVHDKAEFTELSITDPAFEAYLRRIKPDVIFHAAAMINVRESVKDPMKDARVNIMGTLTMAHVAGQIGVKKIVFSSTGGAMYPATAQIPTPETVPPAPISPYGIAKRASELYLNFAYQVHGIPYVALRYANVYGPRQNPKGEAGVISIFSKAMLANTSVRINGSGEQTRDFVFVEDVVQANLLAMASDVVGEFNVGTGVQTSVTQLFEKLAETTGYSIAPEHGPEVAGDLMHSALNSQKAEAAFGWKPQVDLATGLVKTVDWFKTQ
jgi:UDP-glucose 4-epimerase